MKYFFFLLLTCFSLSGQAMTITQTPTQSHSIAYHQTFKEKFANAMPRGQDFKKAADYFLSSIITSSTAQILTLLGSSTALIAVFSIASLVFLIIGLIKFF